MIGVVPAPVPTRILGLTTLVDLVAGLVLSAVGLARDSQTLAIVGVVLLLSGAGMLAFVTWQHNLPEAP